LCDRGLRQSQQSHQCRTRSSEGRFHHTSLRESFAEHLGPNGRSAGENGLPRWLSALRADPTGSNSMFLFCSNNVKNK
jgi:hypothetical protein